MMRTRRTRLRRFGPALVIVLALTLVVAVIAVVSVGVGASHVAARPKVASTWQTLATRLVPLARLAPGQPCPATQTHLRVSPDYGVALGNGPAYVVGGAATGGLTYIPSSLFPMTQGTTTPESLGGALVRWQIAPTYSGPVLVRGRQLDGPNQVSFNGGLGQPASNASGNASGNALGTEPVLSELHLMGGGATAPAWPTWVTLTRLAHPGCYAYQVAGLTFSYSMTFRAVSELG